MAEYTYADVIIDPEDPRVEIGAKYYRADYPKKVLFLANNEEDYFGTLEEINTESPETPFVVRTGSAHSPWACIIRKKEPYEERQAEWVEKVGLKSGDEVRILRKFEPNEGGFYYSMNTDGDMDPLVGKVLTVKDVEGDRIRVYNEDKTGTWVWPYFVLEKVWDAPRPMYTEDDIISDPFDKRVLAALGKEVYRGDDKNEVLDAANDGDESEMGFLYEARIATDGYPFRIGLNWRYIIIPKIMPEGKPGEQPEEKPKEAEYVPFDLSKEEDRDVLRGKWVKLDQDGFFYEFQITEFIRICDEASTYMVRLPNGSQKTGEELLMFFVFLDGSPVGKQMASK